MKSSKYNLAYNTRDQLQSLAIDASERKQDLILVVEVITSSSNNINMSNKQQKSW